LFSKRRPFRLFKRVDFPQPELPRKTVMLFSGI
jgi:hypothetical protein